MALVGFFDILGTQAAVMADRFSDVTALDFAGPAGVAAQLFGAVRVAVFSDCVIVSSESGDGREFLRAVTLMYGQWSADCIQVRGGVAEGDIRWVDHDAVDVMCRRLPNFTCARVYGRGLVLAHQLESHSGPGAIAYVTERAAQVLLNIDGKSVLQGVAPMLCWASQRQAQVLVRYAAAGVEREPQEGDGRRHALGTKHYWEQVIAQEKFLPDIYEFTS